jgi:NADPH:quinone reductase-like Zn-dependent oxidoreductase
MRPSEGLRRPKRAELGNDLTGRVEAVGRDVEEFRPGDEVFGTGLGAWAEYAVARRSHLVRKPAGVSFELRRQCRSRPSLLCRLCAT